MSRQQMIIRAKELEHLYDTTKKPILKSTSVEDVDERYQDMLEYNEWRREVIEKYSELAKTLGVPSCDIRTIASRITTHLSNSMTTKEVHFKVSNSAPMHHLTSLKGFIPVTIALLHPELQTLIKRYHNTDHIMIKFDRSYITIFCNHRNPNLEVVIEKITN